MADPEADEPDSAELPMFEVLARRAGERAVAGDPPVRSRRNLWFAEVAIVAAAVGVTGALLRDSPGLDIKATAPLVIVQTVALTGSGPTDGGATKTLSPERKSIATTFVKDRPRDELLELVQEIDSS
ncbi:MAG: hypothetical protein ACR2L6_12000 [Gemmatimonadaceae bacterium]